MMDKIALAIGLGTLTLGSINDLTIPFLGVPLNVVSVAAFGSIVSFAWGTPIKERKKLYVTWVASTFTAATFVAVVPLMMGWDWVSPSVQPPFAGLMAAGMRFFIPPFIEMIPEVVRKVFRLPSSQENKNEK